MAGISKRARAIGEEFAETEAATVALNEALAAEEAKREKAPWADDDPDYGEGWTDTEEDARFRAKIESSDA